MQKVILSLAIAFLVILVSALQLPPEQINWLSLTQAEEKQKMQDKPILIDVYTDWCGWCKVMDKKTYSRKSIAQYLNDKFYCVKLDAETKESIKWKGRDHVFNPAYRVNEAAFDLLRGEMAYPTTVIIPANGKTPQVIPGYLEAGEFEKLIHYFGDGFYTRMSYDQYQQTLNNK